MIHHGSIILLPFLEMTIFCKTVVHITIPDTKNHSFHFKAVIIEHNEDSITVEAEMEFMDNKKSLLHELHIARIIFCISVIDGVIEFFPVILGTTVSTNGHTRIIFSNPQEGNFKNRRMYKRISISPQQELLQAIIKGRFGRRKNAYCDSIIDISEASTSVCLDNDTTLLIDSNELESFSIRQSGKTVFYAYISGREIDSTCSHELKHQRLILYFENAVKHKRYQKRRARRVVPPKDLPVFVEANHPLLPGFRIKGQVENFSKLGLSFLLKDSTIPVFPGLILNNLTIHIPYKKPLITSVRVVHCSTQSALDGCPLHLGVEIRHLSDDLNLNSSMLYLQDLDSTLFDAEPEDFERIINHLFISRFIHPQKRMLLQKHSSAILKTQYTLLHRNTISKTIVSKKSGVINGFIQYLKYHDHAWLVQHLAGGSKCSPAAGKSSVMATIDFFLHPEVNRSLGVDYVLCYFRNKNPFPMILFDGFSKFISDPLVSQSIDYEYCIPIQPNVPKPSLEELICCPASYSDLEVLEKYIKKKYGEVYQQVEALGKYDLISTRLSKEYKRYGLVRERHVFCVKTMTETPVAFSVCENFSPGTNLSELTNSFKIYCLDTNDYNEQNALNMLVHVSVEDYQRSGITNPVLLTPPSTCLPDQFRVWERYKFWYINALYFDDLKMYSEEITSDFKKHLRSFRNTQQEIQYYKSVT